MLTNQQGLGIGTFVTLDYYSGQESRNEYAVMLLSDNWASLSDLLYDPQAFLSAWKTRYTSTPSMNFGVGTNPVAHNDWTIVGPVTIQIEPLTVPTPGNLVLLSGLTSMYPKLAPVLKSTRLPQQGFATKVRDALSSPLKRLPERNPLNMDPSNYHQTATQFVRSCTTKPPAKPLAYIVEFAVLTRILTIKYVPRAAESSPRWFQTLDAYEASLGNNGNSGREDFTGINMNNVAGTDLTFMHFDINFEDSTRRSRTHQDVSRRRADFVMSFLEQPGFFATMDRPDDIATLAIMKPDDFNHDLGQPLSIRPYPVPGVQLYKHQLGPTVTIDSVYSPNDPQIANSSVPFICVLGQTTPIIDPITGVVIGWNIGGVTVKSYMAPATGTPGGG